MHRTLHYRSVGYPLALLTILGGMGSGAFVHGQTATYVAPAPADRMQNRTTDALRKAAAAAAAAARAAAPAATTTSGPLKPNTAGYVVAPPGVMNPLGTPDYFSGLVPNWANSPAIRKFVDTLPGLGPANANNLGNYIPIATKNTTTFPGSDYYNIAVVEYTQQLHSDLPPTKLRGYKDLAGGDGKAHYLGPVIIATRDVPVRMKLQNQLPTGTAGNLFIPVDTTLMGAGTGGNAAFPNELYTQNRAELHLHGGLNPWISDGTPHQWVTPPGETTHYPKGVTFQNVPDMGAVNPSPSATDGVATYFWSNQQSGRLLFYHDHSYGITRLNVYAGEAAGYLITDPVEEPLITSGVLPDNGGGVYRYGIPLIIQDKTFVPGPTQLAQQDPTWDTAHWGGMGNLWYPHVYMPNQNPYNLTGANPMGRWDYGPWFWPPLTTAAGLIHGTIAGAPGQVDIPGMPNPSLTPEAFMDTMVINGTPYPKVTLAPKAYRFRILNASNDRMINLSFFYADPANPTEIKMVPAAAGTPTFPANWPTDGRAGGVPDPLTSGPSIIQIGTESGFLPTPVVLPPQPVTYLMDRRNIVVLNVDKHGLFLGPAERADVIVDFSSVPAGSNLILYNDAPAPVPAFDPRLDYYTGDPDQTSTGGAPSTPIGYGPNTRTLMQVQIAGTAAPAFNTTNLNAAFTSTGTSKSVFAAAQHPPIVPQTFYNSAMGTAYAADTYSTIQANTLAYNRTENNAPVVQNLEPKAIQELFELNYGRMNATLGVELARTNFNIQTTVPLGYSDPLTEVLTDGTTQLWKITHNGVDTHPVHFHLFDVQVVNRVGWDGAVRFPDPNEIGWKETVRMNPLEDIIVAFRPLSPNLPFVAPLSSHADPLYVTGANISVIDPLSGNPLATTNAVVDYGWEYVWHCHILGHEENDFMRPVSLHVATTLPANPTVLVATKMGPTRVDLAWTDNATDETGYRIERQTGGAGPFVKIGTTVPDQASFSDMSVVSGTSYAYRVFAYNQKGDSAAPTNTASATPGTLPVATGVTLTPGSASPYNAGTAVTFTAAGAGSSNYQYQFWLYNYTTLTWTQVQAYGPAATWTLPTTLATGNYALQVWTRTGTAAFDAYATVRFSVVNAPATGVIVTPSVATPFTFGTPVVFTPVGLGSSGYQFAFWLYNYQTTTWTQVQAYGVGNTWTLPGTTAAGHYALQVWTRTGTAAYDAYTSYNFNVVTPAATGLTISPNTAGPFGTNSGQVFTATGLGSSNYQYEFFLYNGVSYSLVQAYGPGNTWTLPAATPVGSYSLQVWVRTSPTVTYDTYLTTNFTVN